MDLKELSVEAYTTPLVFVAEETETIDHAISLMEREGIRHLPVASGAKIVGLVSDRDLKPYAMSALRTTLTLKSLVHDDLYTVHDKTPLLEVVYHMSDAKIGSAIVVDDYGKLTGIFTTTDALNALVEIIRGEVEEEACSGS